MTLDDHDDHDDQDDPDDHNDHDDCDDHEEPNDDVEWEVLYCISILQHCEQGA